MRKRLALLAAVAVVVSLTFALGGRLMAQAPAAGGAEKAYRVEPISGSSEAVEEKLNAVHAEGWELVAVTAGEKFIFKRKGDPGG